MEVDLEIVHLRRLEAFNLILLQKDMKKHLRMKRLILSVFTEKDLPCQLQLQ